MLALFVGVLYVAAPARAAIAEENLSAQEEKNPLEHVTDSYHIELFESFGPREINLPYADLELAGYKFRLGLSKFMLLEVIAAVLVALFYIPLAQRLRSGALPKGWRDNAATTSPSRPSATTPISTSRSCGRSSCSSCSTTYWAYSRFAGRPRAISLSPSD
jgi:hypothetical protein